jgi:hypothetical protein
MTLGLKANAPLGTNVARRMIPQQMENWRLERAELRIEEERRAGGISPSNTTERVDDVTVLSEVLVDDISENRSENSVHDDVTGVEERLIERRKVNAQT